MTTDMSGQGKNGAVKADTMPVEEGTHDGYWADCDDEYRLRRDRRKRVVSKYKPSRHSR